MPETLPVQAPQQDFRVFNVKDIVIILTFLAGIAGIYTNVNERLVKLETKGDIIAQQLSDIKGDTARMVARVEDSIKSVQNQLRDLEMMLNRRNMGK